MHSIWLRAPGLSVWLGITLMGFLSAAAGADRETLSPRYPAGLDRQGILEQASEFYRQGRLEEALEGFEYLADLGIKNGYLYYNLGNTCFRLGRLGEAILWYERATRYLPRFRDLQVNFAFARNALADEEFQKPAYGGTLGLLLALHGFFNLREGLMLTTGLFWLLAALVGLRWFLPNGAAAAWLRIPCWILIIAFILSCFSSAFKIYQHECLVEAIVMSPAVEVKTGPGNDFSTSFSLHEGTKVSLVQDQGDWVRITLPGNTLFTGWLPKSTIQAI
ncbi:MAG TPA: tetratricopeptide repeat protein [bacterium]|nr:tetratricopeptide repeat protein [bacterium]